ncbi:MAG: hypothetical protein QNJ90_08675 [Planctomycetota bacterium]|nr:hypothetical protein [Planctomycetota bacterium]
MSEERPFDFDLEPKDEAPATTPEEPRAAPAAPAPALKRTSRRVRAERPSKRSSVPDEAEAAGGGKAARFLGWIVSPTFYYLLGFLTGVGVLLVLYNPHWGAYLRAWPHEVLGLGGGEFAWNPQTTRIITLLAVVLAFAIALVMRPGRGRSFIVLFAMVLALLRFEPPATGLHPYMLAVTMALVGGMLLVVPASTPGRRVLLLVGVFLLAAHMFLPSEQTRIREAPLQGTYHSAALVTVNHYVSPPEGMIEESGLLMMLLRRLPSACGLLLLAVGLLSLIGLGGRWVRWTAGSLLVLAVLGSLVSLYNTGTDWPTYVGLDAWKAGVSHVADRWFPWSMACLLGLAGALSEIVGRRARE